ncbi:hypothetical protein ACFYX8_17585 [Streptomyces cyaneofuscatus]|uniref:hypothetical protein n=1 Tax=Streptomyces cyaneofuscatus TaxID=66883 RepID=UPI0036C610BC
MKEARIPAQPGQKREWPLFLGLGVALVAIAGGCVAILNSELGPLERSAGDFVRALGAGDGRSACAGMTRAGRADFAATYQQRTCEEAVAKLVAPLTSAERAQLSDTDTRSPETDPPLGHVGLGSNPLQLSQLVLTKVDGEWLVTSVR